MYRVVQKKPAPWLILNMTQGISVVQRNFLKYFNIQPICKLLVKNLEWKNFFSQFFKLSK